MDERGLVGRIAERSALAGVDVDAALAGALASYVELLRRWSRRMNLTGLGTDDSGLDRLVVEPLVAARYLPAGEPVVVDVGSGGGSPAVPLKLASPRVGLRMVESKGRKAAFLREVVRQLGLEDVVVEARRFEQLVGRRGWQGSADVVTVRAVRLSGQVLDDLQSL
ncbi:MAG: class I SAM-dependent methyltransferase, partial [Vicinamibacterales bacterium]|nr:class I SAM-dependent methyltransferase [Vicinamibacterales bacterium]